MATTLLPQSATLQLDQAIAAKIVNLKNESRLPVYGLPDLAKQQAISLNEQVNTTALAKTLTSMGCPENKSTEMAKQLTKRSKQLAKERNHSHEEAMAYLLNLMKQGWAAQKKNDAD